jgi:superfamily II DNA/RNA helicase
LCAEKARHLADPKTRQLIDWIRKNLCPELPVYGKPTQGKPPKWNNRRVLIFTENREGTKRYLKSILEQAIEGSDRAEERIEVIDGLTSSGRRKEIQRRFNTDPAKDPLRILLATDAAREGLNFQAHCADLFHFDLPWNPGRIEQRNGRIDRKLQPAPESAATISFCPSASRTGCLMCSSRRLRRSRRSSGASQKWSTTTLSAGLNRASGTAKPSSWCARSNRLTSIRRRSASLRKSLRPRGSARRT